MMIYKRLWGFRLKAKSTLRETCFFDMVYQLRFKNLPLSDVEILESEAMQNMEHAYYLSEQLSIF